MSRVSVRGTLTNARNEITRTQVEALNSTLWSDIHTSMTVASKTKKGVERIDQGSSASYRRIRKGARANQKASSARTPPAA